MPEWVDKCVTALVGKKTKEFKEKNDRDPNEDELKEITSSAYAICNAQYKDIQKSEKTAVFELVGDFQKMNIDNELYIYGPSSVEVLDKQNDIMKMDAIESALPELLKRARISIDHRDMMVGEILTSKELSGHTYETGVRLPNARDLEMFPKLPSTEKALFIFGKIWSDTAFCKSAIDFINNKEYNSFSLAGRVISYNRVCDADKCYRLVNKLNLSSVSIVRDGANPLAKFEIVKSADVDVDYMGEEMTTDIQKEDKPKENIKDKKIDDVGVEKAPEITHVTKEDFDNFKKEIQTIISNATTPKEQPKAAETQKADIPKTDPIVPAPKADVPAPAAIDADKIKQDVKQIVIDTIKKDFTVVQRSADVEKPKKTWKDLVREYKK
ncbi:MAG: hypothetical protein WC319_04800 [Candidatus Paceibacterota bacterium]